VSNAVELGLIVDDALEDALLLLWHRLVEAAPLVEVGGLQDRVARVGVQGVEETVPRVVAVPAAVGVGEARLEGLALGFVTRAGLADLLDCHDDLMDLDEVVGDLGASVLILISVEISQVLTDARSSAGAASLAGSEAVVEVAASRAATKGSEGKRMTEG
jgi:hypothetical protein